MESGQQQKRHPNHGCVRMWQVMLIVFFLGTLPGLVSAVVFTHNASQDASEHIADTRRLSREGCERDNDIRREVNNRVQQTADFKAAMYNFVVETRRARNNKGGSSYDPHFVKVIDESVLPALGEVGYQTIDITNCVQAYPLKTLAELREPAYK